VTRHSSQRGFTMVELAVTLVIAAILAAIAFPSMATMMVGNRIRAGGTDLMSALLLARSEAIKRNAQIAITPSTAGDWTKGWVVASVATGEQYDRKNAFNNDVVVNSAPAQIVYNGSGRLAAAGTTQVEFADVHGRAEARCLSIDLSGLPHLSLGACA